MSTTKTMEMVNGAELISRAAMDAGVNFFAGYPITPASSVYTAMLRKLQMEGKIAVGTSDEISGIGMCIGASIRGAKSMSSTAAPGLALMVESLAYAFMTETPFVLVIGQRLGPSTGAATQSAQGDISFVANVIAGGYKIPVIAPSSIHDCYEATFNAVNISEKFRTPVILLTEKDVIMSTTNIDPTTLPKMKAVERTPFKGENFRPYDFGQTYTDIPGFLPPGAPEHKVVVTASLHDKDGRLTKNHPEAFEILEHLRAKIDDNAAEMTFVTEDYDDGANVALISFLATDLAAKQAVADARAKGLKVKHLTLKTLLPIPEKQIKDAINGCKTIIIPEENLTGQYADIIQYLLKDKKLVKVNHIGNLVPPQMIQDALMATNKG